MKKEVEMVLEVYRSLMMDFRSPVGLSNGDILSLKQLSSLINTRGLGVVYNDIPGLLKLIDQSLTVGFVSLPSLRNILGAMPDSNIPRIFHEQLKLLYTEEGELLDPVDPNDVFAVRQLIGCFKRINRVCSDNIKRNALDEFRLVDRVIEDHEDAALTDCGHVGRRFQLIWSCPTTIPHMRGSLEADAYDVLLSYGKHSCGLEDIDDADWGFLKTLRKVSRYVLSAFPEFKLDRALSRCGHGPGATSEKARDKYAEILDAWDVNLALTNIPMDSLCFNEADERLMDTDLSVRSAIPVRILAVPKTLAKPRIIGAESSARMWLQQGGLDFFKRYLSKVTRGGIRLNDQVPSQIMAREGSITGGLATLDLSSASDLLSKSFVTACFASRPDILEYLVSTRARTYSLGDGEIHTLAKFSHMGSALTFPVQSLCYFLVAVTAVLRSHENFHEELEIKSGMVKKAMSQVRVFGDDIIVPDACGGLTAEFLIRLGMKVNKHKSHYSALSQRAKPSESHFRESCGFDGFNGYNVTPIYVTEVVTSKDRPESTLSIVEVSNNFHRAGLWQTARTLMAQCGDLCVPTSCEPVPLGFYTFSSGTRVPEGTRKRTNRDWQVTEHRVVTPSSTGKTRPRECGYSNLLQFEKERNPDVPISRLGFYTKKSQIGLKFAWIQMPHPVTIS